VRRNWTRWRPASLQEAVEGCLHYAQDKHRFSVDRLADLMGESKWTIYKWIQSGSIPARKIAGFEAHCQCSYITAWLAASARRIVVELPSGRLPGTSDIHALQNACHEAIGLLISFAAGRADKKETMDALTVAIEHLATERAHVDLSTQPELSLS
jgi:hypothetical protein